MSWGRRSCRPSSRVWPTDRLSVARPGSARGLLYAQMSADGVLDDGPITETHGGRKRAGARARPPGEGQDGAGAQAFFPTRWLERQLNDPTCAARRPRATGGGGRSDKMRDLEATGTGMGVGSRPPGARGVWWWTSARLGVGSRPGSSWARHQCRGAKPAKA